MDLAYLKKIVRIVEHSAVDEIEVEEEGLRIKVAKNSHNNAGVAANFPGQAEVTSPPPALLQGQPPAAAPEASVAYHEIKSPIVGTFYRSPAPDAEPYVEIGQVIQPKQVLCIIEAMKLMNEIDSDIAGRVVKVLVESGKPVEYNQTLFLIEPT